MIFTLFLKRILQIDVASSTSFRLPYLLGKADYIFVDDFHPLIYTVRFRRSQEVIQVWHAVGAFKTVGFSRTGKRVNHLLIH
ncbi:CDP-glycerol glycerophosphotransferase family protein [Staphylococcus aureus]|nr:CDP-glycerol glycerophosphotransferase family protein [Staphylococcus aureus]